MMLALDSAVGARLAMALIHFLWQGLAVWCVGRWLIIPALPQRAQIRYVAYCLLLATMSACPIATFIYTSHESRPMQEFRRSPYSGVAATNTPGDVARETINSFSLPSSGVAIRDDVTNWLHARSQSIVVAWLVGVSVFLSRLWLGTALVLRIARQRQPIPAQLALEATRLSHCLGFRSPPDVFAVERLSQAIAIGIFKPMVLLPAAWILELPSDVLEAVLAHELAHLRRWDLVINLVQRGIEAMLFFHPAVWWCSRRVRIEREMCCDELAAGAINNRTGYANALALLAGKSRNTLAPLLATGVGDSKMVLLSRVRNVLGLSRNQPGRARRSIVVSILALIGIAGLIGLWRIRTQPSRGISIAVPPGKFPTERAKAILPAYTIEPPDILLIESIRVMPKPPYHIQSADVLHLEIDGLATLFDKNMNVDPGGIIDLGPRRGGKVKVAGLTIDEAGEAITKAVSALYREPEVSVTLAQSTGMQPISGEHLVAPDGTVNFGLYGSVVVAGLTLEQAQSKIQAHLEEYLDQPAVSITVFAYNSKVYYVIMQGPEGDFVNRKPITGSETVLDAVSGINGLSNLADKNIWIARPTPRGAAVVDTVLPVNYQEITEGADPKTNVQILPGDRVFITDPPNAWNFFLNLIR